MPSDLAPIAFFAFNRPSHTARTLAALGAARRSANSDLHAFVDGARTDAEQTQVEAVIDAVKRATGFRSVNLHASQVNKGLYRSITEGVSQVLVQSNRVVVVEDDVLVSPFFLEYMNDALERYGDESRVGSVHGYSPPLEGLPEYFFLPGADCWGWATWVDRWSLFESDPKMLLNGIVTNGLVSDFCRSHGTQSLLQLARRVRGHNQSWAIMWHASLFLARRLTLHPGRSFVQNIGNDGSGVHAAATNAHSTQMVTGYAGLPVIPVHPDERAAAALSKFLDAGAVRLPRVVRSAWARGYAEVTARFSGFLAPSQRPKS